MQLDDVERKIVSKENGLSALFVAIVGRPLL